MTPIIRFVALPLWQSFVHHPLSRNTKKQDIPKRYTTYSNAINYKTYTLRPSRILEISIQDGLRAVSRSLREALGCLHLLEVAVQAWV